MVDSARWRCCILSRKGCAGKAGGWHKLCLKRGRPPIKDMGLDAPCFFSTDV